MFSLYYKMFKVFCRKYARFVDFIFLSFFPISYFFILDLFFIVDYVFQWKSLQQFFNSKYKPKIVMALIHSWCSRLHPIYFKDYKWNNKSVITHTCEGSSIKIKWLPQSYQEIKNNKGKLFHFKSLSFQIALQSLINSWTDHRC